MFTNIILNMVRINKDAQKRVIKLLEHYVRKTNNYSNTLTNKEENELLHSFITNEEIDTFNYFKSINERVRYAFSYFGQVKFICLEQISEIYRYTEQWVNSQKTEKMINSLINEFDEIDQKQKIINYFIQQQNLELTDTDKENSEFGISNQNIFFKHNHNLQSMIQTHITLSNDELIEFKTVSLAIKNFLTSSGLKVTTYLELIQKEETIVQGRMTSLTKIKSQYPNVLSDLLEYEKIKVNDESYEIFQSEFLEKS